MYRSITHRFSYRLMMLLGVAIMSVVAYAADVDKTYRKLIEKYDVADEAKIVDANAPVAFWNATIKNNELLRKFNKNMKKNRGAEKEANTRTMELPRMYPLYDESVVEQMQGFCDTLLMDMGIKDMGVNCSLYVVDSDNPNYFSAMTEDGFAICLTSGLVAKKGVTREILMGYVANEFAHNALLHSKRGFYADAKQRRKDNLIGTLVGTAVLTAVCLTPDAYSPDHHNHCGNGDDPATRDDSEADKDYKKEITSSAIEFSQRYSHEQIYEADLIAYRFLENMGSGEDFINGLRILGSNYDSLYEENRYDRPSTSERIDFLKYVQNNPQIGNKINAHMRQQAPQAAASRKRRR
ncbi:MAG: hypothetical protein K2J63_13170 [Muribaculaceae bacterium]|nr:hypothetical protein [Muribaculaceae bacterium]MDE6796237.1 hypothetical protein [Muribaculaceae bacterium]